MTPLNAIGIEPGKIGLVRRLTSMQRKGGDRTKALFAGKMVRIWSDEWRAWWRPRAQGYTDNIDEAGVFEFEDAWSRSHHCGPEKRIVYHEVQALKTLSGDRHG